MNAAFEQAIAMQRQASGPEKSIFVSANAGSGKTRVLVDRVSRILLAGTSPDKILCLTYTKAAASEMQERLFAALGKWSIIDKDDLAKTLNVLEGTNEVRSEEELGRARRLFARALETPGGLKVQTIHAFCERILKRFPLEAGLLPGSEALDDADARALHQQVIKEVQSAAMSDPAGAIGRAIQLLAAAKGDADFDGLYSWAMGNAYKIDDWRKAGGANVLANAFGISPELNAESAMRAAWEAAPKEEIKAAASEMQAGGKTDKIKAEAMFAALQESDSRKAYEHYKSIFFTQKGKPNARIVTDGAGSTAISLLGNAKTGYQPEALRMLGSAETVKAASVLALTQAMHRVAVEAVDRYRTIKKSRRLMDFDDQIYLAKRLLTDSEARDWVRYKLDGGVDHILVDEAQDTSDTQWQIIDALSEEFFQPSPDRDPKSIRTLFAVGDEKQSIYSFQGAKPEVFLEKITALRDKQKQTPDVRMSMSFRSAPQILELVDQIFYEDGAIAESFGGDVERRGGHEARRDDLGVIEFWPAAKAPEKPEPETAWKPEPVDAPAAQSTREQLARQIAIQIKTWLETGEPVAIRKPGGGVENRPMQARDIMILVTKRLPFFDGIIRNLKEQGVPVAGADRLQLSDSIAVQDLLSLAKFILLPSDDLSLAEILKSPLFGWSELQLFDVAAGRGDISLWQALPSGPDKKLLKRLQGLAGRHAPYEFFARSLALVPDPKGPSLLQKIYNRVGIEATDALDAFLARALSHQRRGAPSLAKFIAEIERDENKIKREMDTAQNEVRVMTVHAAKGLESPVVILPDTTQLPSVSRERLYPVGDGFVMNVRSADQPAAMKEMIEACKAGVLREHLRLLYVALTRAESRLLVCGYESHNKVAEGSWHDRVGASIARLESVETFETPFGDGWRYGQRQSSMVAQASDQEPKTQLPDFLKIAPGDPKKPKQRLSPSKLISDMDLDLPVRSPLDGLGTVGLGRFGRGNIIHKLLQILPDIAVSDRRQTARNYLEKQVGVDKDAAPQIEDEVFAVLEHPEYAQFFAKGSQAEVAIAGSADDLPSHVELNGQIDRLCVQGDKVWIVDYKSNRPPPSAEADVSEIYVRQMAAYRSLVRNLYPGKQVICALLWTDGPRLMPLSDARLDRVEWQDLPS